MKQIEEIEQIKTVVYLRILKNQGKIIEFFAPINENKASKQNKALAIRIEQKSRRMGKRKGVSDLIIIFENCVMFMEMKQKLKRLKNGRLSNSHSNPTDEQLEFLELANSSYVCDGLVAYGFDNAKEIIDKKIKELENE